MQPVFLFPISFTVYLEFSSFHSKCEKCASLTQCKLSNKEKDATLPLIQE
uniref:Uncharacterized protein n=1 Tax=Rhizophora mucronata TaxID=61149 RepID=A0A2P2QZV3_RHIMU